MVRSHTFRRDETLQFGREGRGRSPTPAEPSPGDIRMVRSLFMAARWFRRLAVITAFALAVVLGNAPCFSGRQRRRTTRARSATPPGGRSTVTFSRPRSARPRPVYAEFLETAGRLLPPPNHVPGLPFLAIGPGTAHPPRRYDSEFEAGVDSQNPRRPCVCTLGILRWKRRRLGLYGRACSGHYWLVAGLCLRSNHSQHDFSDPRRGCREPRREPVRPLLDVLRRAATHN